MKRQFGLKWKHTTTKSSCSGLKITRFFLSFGILVKQMLSSDYNELITVNLNFNSFCWWLIMLFSGRPRSSVLCASTVIKLWVFLFCSQRGGSKKVYLSLFIPHPQSLVIFVPWYYQANLIELWWGLKRFLQHTNLKWNKGWLTHHYFEFNLDFVCFNPAMLQKSPFRNCRKWPELEIAQITLRHNRFQVMPHCFGCVLQVSCNSVQNYRTVTNNFLKVEL